MAEFPIPEILQAETADNIHDWMLSIIPDDIDKSEGSFVWDMTRPAAERLSYFSQFILPEAIRTAFPRYSYGVYLEQLAKAVNVNPKTATAAIGTVTVTGEAGTEIPLGSIFSTESSVATESIDFATTQAATIPESGTVDIPVECTVAGADGNVAIGTIIMKASSLPEEVTSVTNAEATTGGTDAETDEALQERIEGVEQSIGVSYVGSVSDYKRWAESVPGVGKAIPVPAQDNSGAVTITITDANGEPASEALCQAVYDYIMGKEENQSDRLTNINASLSVISPSLCPIYLSTTVYIDEEITDAETIKEALAPLMNEYLLEAAEKGVIYGGRIGNLLMSIDGVLSFGLVRTGTENTTSGLAINTTIDSNTQFPYTAAEFMHISTLAL